MDHAPSEHEDTARRWRATTGMRSCARRCASPARACSGTVRSYRESAEIVAISRRDHIHQIAEWMAAGALGNAAANFVGNYPWWLTMNLLDDWLPPARRGGAGLRWLLLRSAALGTCATCVSDCCSNGIRVIKTTRQTSAAPISYAQVRATTP